MERKWLHPARGRQIPAGLVRICFSLCWSLFCPLFFAQELVAQSAATLKTDTVSQERFIGVHGRQSCILGYSKDGLEVWGYPFQILSGYQAGFLPKGAASEVAGRLLLRRVDYQADSVTRVYVGADYLVREKLFVPLEGAAAMIQYEVQGTRPIDIVVHFEPVLDLMWPGAVGGQYTRWIPDGPGYEIAEPEHGISALVGSPETVTHDDVVNSTVRAGRGMSFTMRPAAREHALSRATVYIALNPADTKEPAAALHGLAARADKEETKAAAHYAELRDQSLRLHTPDGAVNDAISWAEVALDQAWVCNPRIGCGLVAGYGPSRAARRPQYAWYFAGDGLIATDALVATGEYTRAKDELEFVMKYQEPKTGMIWHEISQSAGYLDWAKYPYMYVHVDISFDFLSTVARYVAGSGDRSFAMDHWASIAKAYAYCRSLISESDHLPHIPADKEGGDEQARPGDDLSLSAGWLAASAGFEELARLTGHAQLATAAHAQNQLVRQAIPLHYWDAAANFWIDGHTQAGLAIAGRRHGPSELTVEQVFSSRQEEALLDQLASSDFQSDWGARELASNSADYDPYSYGRGSVSALGTARTAAAFWEAHRPAVGYAMWSALLPWNTLDAPGHLDEVLAGNFYQEQTESVPEQTWSSAGLLDSAVHGLFGLKVDGRTNVVELNPHLPPQWDRVSIENVRLPGSTLAFVLSQGIEDVDLEVSNQGAAARLIFRPQIPLGAQILNATVDGVGVPVKVEIFTEDEHASLSFTIPPGMSRCHVRFSGGVSIMLDRKQLYVGDASTGLRLRSARLKDHVLSVDADVHPQGGATFTLRTPWRVTGHTGASVRSLADHQYEVTLTPRALTAGADDHYEHLRASISFVPE